MAHDRNSRHVSVNAGKSAASAGAVEHITPLTDCKLAGNAVTGYSIGPPLVTRLGRALFPVSLHKYKGRWTSLSEVLGYARGSIETYCKSDGDARLTLPLIGAAEKVIAAQMRELSLISEGLALKRRELEAAASARPRLKGMFAVRMRDDTGQPKTGLFRDGWRAKKLEPF